jgi:hypothetical protein
MPQQLQDTTPIYVVSEVFGRGDSQFDKFTIPFSLIKQANDLRSLDDEDDAIDDFLNAQPRKFFTVLCEVIHTDNIIGDFETNGGIGIIGDCVIHGLGTTKALAYQAFVECNEEDPSDWDE